MVHYNLWLELDKVKRYSVKFKKQNNTPDNIIVPKTMFDNIDISYKQNSFRVFKPMYIYKNGTVKRWNMKRYSGFSDHLPVVATFSTTPYKNKQVIVKITKNNNTKHTIGQLYKIQSINNYSINNVVVIYKKYNIAVIKQPYKNSRSILIYHPQENLKLGFSYDIVVNSIETYNGLKEIKSLSYIKQKAKYNNIKEMYLNARNIDIFDLKYQNEIIHNLSGRYKKGYMYFYSKYYNKIVKIKLYFKKDQKRPQDGSNIKIKYAHIGIYKSRVQLDFIELI
jgi:hypothetical protein